MSILIFTSANTWAYKADIRYISAREYFKTALQEINQAEKSIDLFMFVVSYRPDKSGSKPGKLLQALADASDRGIEVSVYLDQNVDFYDGGNEIEGKNTDAAEFLKSNGVKVYLDNKYTFSHSKALVIDGKTTLIGSSNWSHSAFSRNNEANVLVESEQYATEILDDLKSKQKTIETHNQAEMIQIPKSFVIDKNLLGRMVTHQDERAYDIYMWLMMKDDLNKTGKIDVKYTELANHLGIGNMIRSDYRRQITKVLRKLDSEYGLIKAKINYDAPANVDLVDDRRKTKFIEFPKAYWEFEWGRKLSMPGKVMLLINWLYSAESKKSPSWHVSSEDLIERHGISETFIGDGILELRRLNLIDVRYQEVSDAGGAPKQYGVYSPNEIYDSIELEERFVELESIEGPQVVQRARERAEVVFKQNDYEDIKTLIGLEKRYGSELLEEAVGILKEKRTTNPKRHMGYLIGIVKNKAKASEPQLP